MMDRDTRWGGLLARANHGDGVAYATFLTEVAPVLRGIARARHEGGEAEVEDIVQEALLAIHAKRHTWREGEPVSPWLYAIARYKTADVHRARKRAGTQVPVEDLAEVLPDEGAGEVTAPGDVDRLLAGLDPKAAGIVRALGVEGESAGEVGRKLGMSEGAVRVAYHRALGRLRIMVGAKDD